MQNPQNVYLVRTGARLRTGGLRFEDLSRDVQSLVLKHTHAEFEITHHTEVPQHLLGHIRLGGGGAANAWMRRLPNVPVVLRYQFKLQRRLADGPRMIARFSRCLDPALQQTALWQTCPPALQARLEHAARKVLEIEPFSELQYDGHGPGAEHWIFCFVPTTGDPAYAPRAWTRFRRDSAVLDEVREKMRDVFGQPFTHVI